MSQPSKIVSQSSKIVSERTAAPKSLRSTQALEQARREGMIPEEWGEFEEAGGGQAGAFAAPAHAAGFTGAADAARRGRAVSASHHGGKARALAEAKGAATIGPVRRSGQPAPPPEQPTPPRSVHPPGGRRCASLITIQARDTGRVLEYGDPPLDLRSASMFAEDPPESNRSAPATLHRRGRRAKAR